jgi:SAM-dependent methyltransferase
MHALAAIGLLEVQDDTFKNTPVTARYFVAGKPEYVGTGFLHSANLWNRWSTLTQVMRTGQPVDMAAPAASTDWTESFIMAMHNRALTRAPKVADALDLSGVSKLLDLGGGPGTHAIVFAQRKPDLKAVILDLPGVVPIAERIILDAGLSDRVSTRPGDYMATDYGSGYDMVFLSAVIHSNSPDENIHIFKKAYDSLNPGGRIAIVDFILNDEKTDPKFGAIFAVNMLVGTSSGNSYSGKEISSWLEKAGYKDISSPVDVDEDIALMTAVKPG